VKAQFLTELLSVLSWRLSFLAGELQSTLSFLMGGGGGGNVTMFGNKKIARAYAIKISAEILSSAIFMISESLFPITSNRK
jgi:hypothetical protein